MIKIDLITGFLGAGKTTFLKEYIPYLLSNNENIALLEFDFGAVNVDAMILQDFNEKINIETVTGSDDLDCFKRRLKTKLISMALRKYDRVIIEPSGIFDPNILIDIIDEEPLYTWYKINSSLCLVEPNNEEIILNQIATSKYILISKIDKYSKEDINKTITKLNEYKAKYHLDFKIIMKPFDYKILNNSGFNDTYINRLDSEAFKSVYLLNKNFTFESINKLADKLFMNINISRVKGFIFEEKWYLINYTRKERNKEEVLDGQDVMIIIGKGINESNITDLL